MKVVIVADIDIADDVSTCVLGYSSKNGWEEIEVTPRSLPQEGTEFDVIDNKTGKYADLQEIALKEEWAKGLVYCDMEGFAIEQDGTLVLLDECGNCAYPPEGRFKLIWNIGETE